MSVAPLIEEGFKMAFISNKNNKFHLCINYNSSEIEFKAEISGNILSKKFITRQNLEELMKNNYLKTGENIYGIFQIIKYFMEKNNSKLYEDENLLRLIIPIEHPKYKEISFSLLELKKDLNSKNDEKWGRMYNTLIERINNLEKKNEELIKINEKIRNDCSKNEKRIQLLEEKEKIMNENIKKINDKLFKNKIFESKIDIDEELVKQWLNNRKFKANLIFRKTEDGSKSDDFHRKCDNQGITISFIETTNGYKFGGYTELQWEKKYCPKKDNKTFIFSFNNKEKYIARNNEDSIYCYTSYALWFGNGSNPDFIIRSNLDYGECYNEYNNTFIIGRKLTNGEQFFDIKELEVFKIIYI